MSTKETLPTGMEPLKRLLEQSKDERFVMSKSDLMIFIETDASLRKRLEAAEKELKESQSILGTCQIELTESEVELAQLKQANAELVKDRDRLDWLQSHGSWHDQEWRFWVKFPVATILHITLRQAIDAAITKGTV